jgi:hypothetical protein
VADRKHENPEIEDGRPAEVREGETPQAPEEREEDVQDDSTVESVGY